MAGVLAGLALLRFGTPAVRADLSPPGCLGSGLGISLFTSVPDVHIGDRISYSVSVFNTPFPACDAGWTNPALAGAIRAFIVTPDGITNHITLKRTFLAPGESDYYADIVSYVVRAQDVRSDGTVRATAEDEGDIHQNDTNSRGGGNQGVNTEVHLPCIQLTAQCVGSEGETGAIMFSGTVTNCGNTALVGVTLTNSHEGGSFRVSFPANLAIGASGTFSGSWVPLNPCVPSTATLTVSGIDEFTVTPRVVTSFTTVTCQNTVAPGIQVTKACPPQPPVPGQLFTFSGTVSNTGNVTLTNVVVLNDQPAPNTPVFTLASLAPGAVANFEASYLAPTNCSVADTLIASASTVCGVAVTDTVSATCPIATTPQIAVTAVCPAAPPLPGGSLTYSGTVRNTGNVTLTEIIVTSDQPAANTVVFTADALAPGASATFTSTATLPAGACSITTTFRGVAKDLCTTASATNTVATTCGVATAPSIAVTLACPSEAASTGASITYTGTVRNSGDVTLNNVTVVDTQAVPSTVLTVPTLAPGASVPFAVTFAAPADACSVSSTATASGTDSCAGTVVSNSASATCPLVTTPDIAITQVCPVIPTTPGGLLTYSGTVRNAGNITLTNVIVLNNLSGTTPVFTAATLAPGASADFTGSFLAPTNCSITSTSTATGQSTCGASVTDTVSSTCPITTSPQIAVTAVCPTDPLLPGSSASFSGTVRNTGNTTLTGVVVVSDRPAPNTSVFAVDTLAPGASADFTGAYTVPTNICSISTTFSGIGKDACGVSMVTNTVSTTCAVATAPAIAVTLTCPAVPVASGGPITYAGTVRNAGNVTLTNVMVVDAQAVPGTVLTLPVLAPGASADFTATFTAPTEACSVTSTVTATGGDNCSGAIVTNSTSATCLLVTAPNITITQLCPTAPATPGGLITYNATVSNTGNVPLNNVVVTSAGSGVTPSTNVTTTLWVDDALPAGAVMTTFGGDAWNWVNSNPAPFSGFTAHQSTIATGTHQHVFKFATDTLPVNAGDTLFAYVYLDPANLPSEVMLGWYDGSFEHRGYWGANSIDLGADGTAGRRFMGPLPAAGQWVKLEVPASLVGLEGRTVTGMSFTLYGGRATWDAAGKVGRTLSTPLPDGTPVFTAATLAPGASADFTVSYTLPPDSACSFTSTLTADGADTCTGTRVTANTSSTCPLIGLPAIEVTQTCPTTPVSQGGILTYTGTVRNSGNTTLTNVIVVDNRPAPNTVIFTAASLAPGVTRDFTGSYQVPLNCCVVWSTLEASGQACDGVMVRDTASAICTVSTLPVILVTKVCPPAPVRPGELLEYSGTVSNPGNITLVNVTLTTTQLGVGAPIFGPIALAPGESVSYDASYLVPADFCGLDTVTATGVDACTLASVANSVTTMCPVISTPRIAVTKHCPAVTTPKGGLFTFTGTVSNPGNVTLTNVFVVDDYQLDCYTRTNGPVIGPITLAPGASMDFSGSYTAPESCCEIVDTLTATGQDRCGATLVSATSTTVCPLATTPRIAVTRVCPQVPVPVGGVFAYSGLVSNAGDVVLTNVLVLGTESNGNTPLLGPIELAPGETAAFNGSYTVTAGSDPTADTVTASGTDICDARTVTARANCFGPASTLTITSRTVANGMATFTWTATPGATYRLQHRSSLADPTWIDVPGDVTANAATASKNDAVGSASQGFYRVMVVE